MGCLTGAGRSPSYCFDSLLLLSTRGTRRRESVVDCILAAAPRHGSVCTFVCRLLPTCCMSSPLSLFTTPVYCCSVLCSLLRICVIGLMCGGEPSTTMDSDTQAHLLLLLLLFLVHTLHLH